MNLVLKVAAGIILAVLILWIAEVGFVVVALSAFSQAMSNVLHPPGQQAFSKRTPVSTPKIPQINVPRPTPRRRIVGYREQRVPGRPLAECLGRDKELNEDVLRCRNGYTEKVPIWSR